MRRELWERTKRIEATLAGSGASTSESRPSSRRESRLDSQQAGRPASCQGSQNGGSCGSGAVRPASALGSTDPEQLSAPKLWAAVEEDYAEAEGL